MTAFIWSLGCRTEEPSSSRYDVKIDQNFSEKNRLFARFSHVRNRAFGTNIAVKWRTRSVGAVDALRTEIRLRDR